MDVTNFESSCKFHRISISGEQSAEIRSENFNEKDTRRKFIQILMKNFKKLLSFEDLINDGMRGYRIFMKPKPEDNNFKIIKVFRLGIQQVP
jgi:hypothetical protein